MKENFNKMNTGPSWPRCFFLWNYTGSILTVLLLGIKTSKPFLIASFFYTKKGHSYTIFLKYIIFLGKVLFEDMTRDVVKSIFLGAIFKGLSIWVSAEGVIALSLQYFTLSVSSSSHVLKSSWTFQPVYFSRYHRTLFVTFYESCYKSL